MSVRLNSHGFPLAATPWQSCPTLEGNTANVTTNYLGNIHTKRGAVKPENVSGRYITLNSRIFNFCLCSRIYA